MQFPLKYDFRDILSAPAAALAAKRILVMTASLLVGLITYNIFTYLALLTEGESLNTAIKVYGIFPFDGFYFDESFAFLFYWLGVIVSIVVMMLGMFAVAAFEFESIRGHRFLTIRDSFRFTVKRAKQVLLSELSIISFLVLIIILVALYGLIGRIPFIGEWIFSIFFVIPGFVMAIFSIGHFTSGCGRG
jgi:hypothetical protein